MTDQAPSIADLPLNVRYHHALILRRAGEITGEEALSLIVWPDEAPIALSGETFELCKRGHLRSPENTYVNKAGERRCRVCSSMLRKSQKKGKPKLDGNGKRIPPARCATCGKPCWWRKHYGGQPRCRDCYNGGKFVIRGRS